MNVGDQVRALDDREVYGRVTMVITQLDDASVPSGDPLVMFGDGSVHFTRSASELELVEQ